MMYKAEGGDAFAMMDAMILLLNVVAVGLFVSSLSVIFFFAFEGPGFNRLDRAVKVWTSFLFVTLALAALLRFLRMEE